MKLSSRPQIRALALIFFAAALLKVAAAQTEDDSRSRPPVSKCDVEIVKDARQILDSPQKWNRRDNRICPAAEKTFSLYCALEEGTYRVTGDFAHRAAAMQEARFVIDDDLAPGNKYHHRLMDFNNDPRTTFADVRRFFDFLQGRIEARLQDQETHSQAPTNPAATNVIKTNIDIIKKVEAIINSHAKWDKASTQDCKPDANKFGLYCAFKAASIAVTGKFDGGPAIEEARELINRKAPNAERYSARLIDYNNDPTVSFGDLQALLKTVQTNLERRLTLQSK